MPFTFAHPAIVLPATYLRKRWYSLTGLIVGSITPDFEYFFRLRVKSIYSHTIAGLFYFDLPVALVLCFVYHAAVRRALIANLPASLQRRLSVFVDFDWQGYFKRNWPVVIISILVGAASHLLWDSFTHEHGNFVGRIILLRSSIALATFSIPLFKVCQHLSSMVGLLVITYAVFRLSPSGGVVPSSKSKYWSIVLISASALTLVRWRFFTKVTYGDVVVSFMSFTLLMILIAGAYTALKISRKTPDRGANKSFDENKSYREP